MYTKFTFSAYFVSLFIVCFSSKCPDGWYSYRPSYCLKYFAVNVTFDSAYSLCRSIHSSLISIHSEYEENIVFSIGKRHVPNFSHWVWIGARRVDSSFKWLDNSGFSYTNIPNNCYVQQQSDCLALHLFPYLNVTFWCAFDCSANNFHVVCEKHLQQETQVNEINDRSAFVKSVNSNFSFKKNFNESEVRIQALVNSQHTNEANMQNIIESTTIFIIMSIFFSTLVLFIIVLKIGFYLSSMKSKMMQNQRSPPTLAVNEMEEMYDEAKT
ncbi:hypothetical protein B4U79_19149, partial [Dinothrombium tinctorium]